MSRSLVDMVEFKLKPQSKIGSQRVIAINVTHTHSFFTQLGNRHFILADVIGHLPFSRGPRTQISKKSFYFIADDVRDFFEDRLDENAKRDVTSLNFNR